MTRLLSRPLLLSVALTLLLAQAAAAETRSLLILHTNDIHGHVRPGSDGSGGLPYVAGYVAQERAKRNDVLLLDAGDVMEKGDMVALVTEDKVTYEAMGRMKYDAAVPGNHDLTRGLALLNANRPLLGGTEFLCANCLDDVGKPLWEASHVFEINGLRVGVIGATVNLKGQVGDASVLDFDPMADRIAVEAARLGRDCHVLIVLAHLGVEDCRKLAGRVPSVNVFVGGHTHQLTNSPVPTDSGAVIVQAGCHARWIGSVELSVDTETRSVKLTKGGVVEMRHGAAPCDEDMLARIRAEEQRVCPEAARVVGRSDTAVNNLDMACIAAAALREKAGADIGFCQPRIIYSPLDAGVVDVNALVLVGGQRAAELFALKANGRDIEAYIHGLKCRMGEDTAWAGFKAKVTDGGVTSDLEPERVYSVVMTKVELRRFLTVWDKAKGARPKFTPCAFSFVEALAGHIAHATAEGKSVDQLAACIDKDSSSAKEAG